MVGKMIKDKDTRLVTYTSMTQDGAQVMYPDTAAEMAANEENVNLYGR